MRVPPFVCTSSQGDLRPQAHTFQARLYPSGYRYRDWVVEAFNHDLPSTGLSPPPSLNDCADGFAYMKRHGAWVDNSRPPNRGAFRRPLTAAELAGSSTDQATGAIDRTGDDGRKELIGLMVNGRPMRGFKTPSRKFEIYSSIIAAQADKVGIPDDGWPHYLPVPSHRDLPDDRFSPPP